MFIIQECYKWVLSVNTECTQLFFIYTQVIGNEICRIIDNYDTHISWKEINKCENKWMHVQKERVYKKC